MRSRGSALYLVLLAVMVVSAGSMVILQHAGARHRLRVMDREALADRTLMADAELIAGRWLARHGRSLTTPIEDPYRPTRIVDSETVWRGEPIRLSIDVWDACSGLPCDITDRAFVIAGLPRDVRLDPELPLPAWWEASASGQRPRFPAAQSSDGAHPATALVLGTWAAKRVNWRTAPWEMVQSVLDRADRGTDAAALRQARIGGTSPAQDGPAPIWPADVEPVLVGDTDRWCVLIAFHRERAVRSHFMVMAASGDGAKVLVRHAAQ